MQTLDLFGDAPASRLPRQLADGAWLLPARALDADRALFAAIGRILGAAPLRQMETPGGLRMSVATSSCGDCGWVSDRRGYRYERCDPLSGQPWPAMPELFSRLAGAAAAEAGYPEFTADACLINRYLPGTRLSLHQDRDERDFSAPIVSVSLGLPAVFQFGGLVRKEAVQRVPLVHGDVVVWGGAARLRFHGVLPLKAGAHALLGEQRINLTFRRAR